MADTRPRMSDKVVGSDLDISRGASSGKTSCGPQSSSGIGYRSQVSRSSAGLLCGDLIPEDKRVL